MIWYLILVFTKGGLVVLPEPSAAACQQQEAIVVKQAGMFNTMDLHVCVQGLPQRVEQ